MSRRKFAFLFTFLLGAPGMDGDGEDVRHLWGKRGGRVASLNQGGERKEKWGFQKWWDDTLFHVTEMLFSDLNLDNNLLFWILLNRWGGTLFWTSATIGKYVNIFSLVAILILTATTVALLLIVLVITWSDWDSSFFYFRVPSKVVPSSSSLSPPQLAFIVLATTTNGWFSVCLKTNTRWRHWKHWPK